MFQQRPRKYQFTEDWVEDRPDLWNRHLAHLSGKARVRFLEIGCFEGRSTIWFLEQILTNETSKIDCVDVFSPNYEWANGDYEILFDLNIAESGQGHKVTKLQGDSYSVIRSLELSSYDCVYIDGSHVAADVLQDAVLGFLVLKLGGLLVFDDYQWDMHEDSLLNPRMGIDAFLAVYKMKYQLLAKDYQVIIKRTS